MISIGAPRPAPQPKARCVCYVIPRIWLNPPRPALQVRAVEPQLSKPPRSTAPAHLHARSVEAG
jgi:hypothetical protein